MRKKIKHSNKVLFVVVICILPVCSALASGCSEKKTNVVEAINTATSQASTTTTT